MTDGAERQATLHTVAGKPVLRFERRLAHPPTKVWRAVTDPAEMAHWFPATVETKLEPGAAMRFTFEGEDAAIDGEIIEFDPPKVYAFRWNQDVIRIEIVPEGEGCRLFFSHTLGGDWTGRLGAGRNAAGWDVCLGALEARLAGREHEPPEMTGLMEHYVAEFGLAEGEVHDTGDGYELRFARDLLWRPVEQLWTLLTEGSEPETGAEPPLRFTNGYVPAGPVTAADAPRLLEYEWRHGGAPAGRVRWEIIHDPEFGTRVELTQTVPTRLADLLPTALAAWQTHLEVLFATVLGADRCWPEGRVEELREHYAGRLDPLSQGSARPGTGTPSGSDRSG
ncbi:SRPBCC family protein [Qaidamihabitans albus]|uniref:SRPBCC family protein n=1 Tax=Qaidamihabitans albus TaxID=2795733 RepID=UPI0018F1854D|nr:SRPBCC family protein [Qaidamihabitans albus]